MIKNDWQMRVTQKKIKDFQDALFELSKLPQSISQPWLREAQRESLESELAKLNDQVGEYELLKSGKVALPGPELIEQVPELLIKTRISKGLNQEQLAARLGVSKQCIQQYEQTNYANVTLSTAGKIMQVLLAPHGAATTDASASRTRRKEASSRNRIGTAGKAGPRIKSAKRQKHV